MPAKSFFYKDKKTGELRIRIIGRGTFDCTAGGKAGKHDCTNIPVVILQDGADCLALLPYHDLKIGTNHKEDDVTWKLIGPPDYAFDPNVGIELLSISQDERCAH